MNEYENLVINAREHSAKAFLFDMDGTLVDSTSIIERVWTEFADKHNLNANDVLGMTHGVRAVETIRHFVRGGVDVLLETEELTRKEIMDVDGIKEIAGAKLLLQAMPIDKWAIVTSANRELAMRRLTAVGLPIPKILITAEDVLNGKPAPDAYLLAAKLLQTPADDCIVFEDSVAGLESARMAGMRAIAIGQHIQGTVTHYEEWILNYAQLHLDISSTNTEDMVFRISQ